MDMSVLDQLRNSPDFGVFQLGEYIHAFRSSSDRARYVIFVTTAISLLMLISDWNYLNWSWSRRATERYKQERRAVLIEEWMRARRDAAKRREVFRELDTLAAALRDRPGPAALDVLRLRLELRNAATALSAEQRQSLAAVTPLDVWLDSDWAREWYGGQTEEFHSRAAFAPVPGLGASVHVNDIALVGGVVLLALSALLWAALVRQHENLYLACFKIHKLCAQEKTHHDRDSIANFLYHALAMAQVLSYPPSLARWNHGWRHRAAGAIVALVYLFPAIVQIVVVGQNIGSRQLAYAVWGIPTTHLRLTLQILLAGGIGVFCILAAYYARSCAIRWRKTFFTINPGLRQVEQRPWIEWLNMADSPLSADERRIARELTYRLQVTDETPALEERVGNRRPHDSLLPPRRGRQFWRNLWSFVKKFVTTVPRSERYLVSQRELAATIRQLVESCGAGNGERIRGERIETNELVVSGANVAQWRVVMRARVSAGFRDGPAGARTVRLLEKLSPSKILRAMRGRR
ncbi:MAG TPA: hypothetical protein VGF28_26755 [Thermoanaerobaculia bacterium]|jgi:hypothetical protein